MSVDRDESPPLSQETSKHRKDHSEKKSKKKRKREEAHGSPSTHKRSRSTKLDDATTSNLTPPSSTLHTPFFTQTVSLYLPLSPISQLRPLEGLCAEHLSPLILTYYPPFHGVVLSYKDVRLSESPSTKPSKGENVVLARSIDEYAVSYVWVTAEFVLFKPQRGCEVEGWVNLQNEGHLGLVCWNMFNASIERKRLPKEWKWIAAGTGRSRKGNDDSQQTLTDADEDGEGYYEDAEGNKIEGKISFRVNDIQTSPSSDRERGFVSIEGTLLGDDEEKALLKDERKRIGERVAGVSGRSSYSSVLSRMHNDRPARAPRKNRAEGAADES
ncbi:MAG: hypothetical protein M1819_006354 [Sarea resinae]|nr:MAG: hypothetical protein M1819_006354 [Sarea resinae]